ncbi:MAG: hypothetical protein EU536_00605 [Promethearchaeota archaeon]|nr:MAG: hypothetical protein EU536_00605 [Candidatus Lokiarchaeota archaeon]
MSEKEKNEAEPTYITIFIHEPKQMSETKNNIVSRSSGIVRVRGFHKKEKSWLTLSYMIPISSLGLEESADKKQILDRLLNPAPILNKDTKSLLLKLADQYGDIKLKGRDRLEYKTERFKKKWKMKTRRVGGV